MRLTAGGNTPRHSCSRPIDFIGARRQQSLPATAICPGRWDGFLAPQMRRNRKAALSHRGGKHAHTPTCRRNWRLAWAAGLANHPSCLIPRRGPACGLWIKGRHAARHLSPLPVAQRCRRLDGPSLAYGYKAAGGDYCEQVPESSRSARSAGGTSRSASQTATPWPADVACGQSPAPRRTISVPTRQGAGALQCW